MYKNKFKIFTGLLAIGILSSPVLADTNLNFDQDSEYQLFACKATNYSNNDTVSLDTEHTIGGMGFKADGTTTLKASQINDYFFQVKKKIYVSMLERKRYGHRFQPGHVKYSMTGSGTIFCSAQDNKTVFSGRKWYPGDSADNPNAAFGG